MRHVMQQHPQTLPASVVQQDEALVSLKLGQEWVPSTIDRTLVSTSPSEQVFPVPMAFGDPEGSPQLYMPRIVPIWDNTVRFEPATKALMETQPACLQFELLGTEMQAETEEVQMAQQPQLMWTQCMDFQTPNSNSLTAVSESPSPYISPSPPDSTCLSNFQQQHMNALQPPSPKPIQQFECDECPKSYRHISDLKRHKATIHSVASSFLCEYCGHIFTRKDYLQVRYSVAQFAVI